MCVSLLQWCADFRTELSNERSEEGLDRFFVAFEKVPLPGLLAADQTRPLQGGQVGRHGRLGQAAALVDLPGADAVFVVVQLLGELHFRVFEPGEDVSSYWVRQGFYYFVEVDGHGRVLGVVKRYIAIRRTLNRNIPICQYDFDLRPGRIGISGYNDMLVAVVDCAA